MEIKEKVMKKGEEIKVRRENLISGFLKIKEKK